uniref:Uncharacterized protein n=1 Tax=Anguilla anguilla TaxID=7936 RepID=A0A0E9XQE5_ANGAN
MQARDQVAAYITNSW